MARSITSLDMFAARPLSIAWRRRGLPAGSPPPARAATLISRITLVKIFPRCASVAFLRPSIDGPRPMVLLRVRWLGEGGILPRREARQAPVAQRTGSPRRAGVAP